MYSDTPFLSRSFQLQIQEQTLTAHSHPIHPATVHFPLAFLTLANILNLIYGAVLYLPSNPFFVNDEHNLSSLSVLGYASNVLGIITSIPAVLTGGAELYAMIQGNGLYEMDAKGQKTMVPKVRVALMHVSILSFLRCLSSSKGILILEMDLVLT